MTKNISTPTNPPGTRAGNPSRESVKPYYGKDGDRAQSINVTTVGNGHYKSSISD